MRYIVDHLPKSSPKRPGFPMDWEYVTIHNTGNPASTAMNERDWLRNPSNTSTTGYHIVLDEKEAYQVIPLTENAWHAGDGASGPGNRKSIGIEICESGDFDKSMRNAVVLVAGLLQGKGKPVSVVVQHNKWSGKNCPRLIRAGHKGWTWQKFLLEVELEMEKFKDVKDGLWYSEAIQEVADAGLMAGYPDNTFRPEQPVTRAELAVVLAKLLNLIE